MNLKKRLLSFILVLVLVISEFIISEFSGFVMANSSEPVKQEANEDNSIGENVNIEENKEVRVIVELKSKSLVEEALSQGKKYQDLAESFKDEKTAELKKEQDELIEDLEDNKVDTGLGKRVNYDTVINGVGITVKQKDIKIIEENANVRNVYYSQEFERPLLQSQQEIIGANQAWNTYKYKGEGTVVAVIDSGIDVHHKALVLDDNSRIKYTQAQMESAISEYNLKGKYFTEKVPYGYNYYDFSNNLKDTYGNMHGMHVAGIVGSNSKDTKTYGVAPNTQILAMKVFSDDLQYSTTFTDVWLKALDDAIKLKADVVNLSLGSAAGFSIDEDKLHPEIQIFSKARKAGIVIAVAVGNEANINYGAIYGPESREENYDTGLVANPAINQDTFAVASMENLKKAVYAITWKTTGTEESEDVNLFIPLGVKNNIVAKVIDLKEAKEFDSKKDPEGKKLEPIGDLPNVEGKIVLVKWPETTERKGIFEDTLNNIAIRKPKAILLARPDSKISGRLVLEGEAGKLVYGIIKNTTYLKLATLPLLERVKVFDNRLTINITQRIIDNPLKGRISEFSTWGPTPDLRIKPEITGVGGNIYSTVENNLYRNMSGTSMASPQVAGASLILKQYLDENNIGGNNKSDLIKIILMNTAKIILDPSSENAKAPYFVRRQGAGALNLENALKVKAYVEVSGTNDDIYDGKLELRQLNKPKFKANLKITNISDEKISFKPEFLAVKEKIEKGLRKQIPILINAKFKGPQEVSLSSKETKIIELEFDFTESDLQMDNFLEGFIILKAGKGTDVDLSIPFLGFYGNWGNQRAIDAFALPEFGKQQRNAQFVINPETKAYSSRFVTNLSNALPIIDNKIFFSPDSEYFPSAGVSIAPLRNMEEIEYSILDGNAEKTLKVLGKSLNVRKLNKLNRKNSFLTMFESFWDGMLNGKFAEAEKQYVYQMKVKLNNGGYGDNEQIYQYPIMIDNKKPTIDKDEIYLTKLNGRMQNIRLKVEDKGSGLKDLYIETLGFINANGDQTKPEFDNTPPGTKKPFENLLPPGTPGAGESDKFELDTYPGEIERKESVKAKIVKGNGKGQYGRFVALHFTKERPDVDKFAIVENGKVIIKANEYDFNQYGVNIPVFMNNHEGKIEVEVPILADKTHLEIAAKDYISNRESLRIDTGFKNNFHTINFNSFIYSMADKNMKLFIDDKEIRAKDLPYFTENKEVKIKIQYDDKSHLSDLIIRNGKNMEAIIRGSVVQEKFSEKYNFKYDHEQKFIEFTIKDINSNFDVITTAKDGQMPYSGDKENIKLDFSQADLQRFKKISIAGKEYTSDQLKEGIELKAGQKLVELVYADNIDKDKDTKVASIIVKGKDKEVKLVEGQYFDITGGKQGFSNSQYSININYNFTENSKLIINFGEADIKEILNDKFENVFAHDQSNTDHVNDEKFKPYPAIFVSTPSLLSILNEFNTKENTIRLNGFVGHMNFDDSIKSMKIYLVDNYGNKISEGLTLNNNDFKINEDVHYGKTYVGRGHMFTAELPLIDKFNINIKFDIETRNGLQASMVRRVLYDKLLPTVEYMVESRPLNSDKATVRLKSKDDSIALSLFKGDSLIESVNKASISFESDSGLEITKEVVLELDYGQNEIVFSAKDLSGKVTTKTLYIYRAYDGDIEVEHDKSEESHETLKENSEEDKKPEESDKLKENQDSLTKTDDLEDFTETDRENSESIEKAQNSKIPENQENKSPTNKDPKSGNPLNGEKMRVD